MATTVLREVGQFQLIKDELQGMYRTVNTILLENTEDGGVSYWFGEDTKDTYMSVSDSDFVSRCKQSAGNDINRFVK